jgi:hypothetical protein
LPHRFPGETFGPGGRFTIVTISSAAGNFLRQKNFRKKCTTPEAARILEHATIAFMAA